MDGPTLEFGVRWTPEKKEQDVKYRKDQRVGEARGGWLLGRLMEN